MKAVVISRFGGTDVLQVQEVPEPQAKEHEILVRVMAAGLNRADVLQRQGKYPAPAGAPASIPGLEFSGEIAECGAKAGKWRTGQRVFGIVASGAQAEFVVTHEDAVAEIPAALDWIEAAAVPEVFITAHDALWRQARLAAGEAVLVNAVASGVGLAAVQLARARGATAYGTSRTPQKLEAARKFGMSEGFAVTGDVGSIAEHARRWTNDRGVDVVIDLVGGPYVSASVEALAPRGRMVFVGTVAGARAEIGIGTVMSKRLTLIGTVLRSRSLEEKIEVTAAFAREVVPLLAEKTVRPVVDRVFPIAEIAEAHRRLESNESVGKIVLQVA